jgi:hypothetical protein
MVGIQKMSVSKTEVITALREVYFDYFENTRLTTENFRLHSKISYHMVLKHFGSWENALNQAEINCIPRVTRYSKKTIPEPIFYTEEQLFDELKRVWEKLGRRPTYHEFRKYATINRSVYQKKFNYWHLCIEKFCSQNKGYNIYDNSRNSKTSKTELLQELIKIKKRHPHPTLIFNEYKALGGKHARVIFRDYFGSWQNALELAGLKPFQNRNKIPDTILLLAELQNIIESLGRNPSPQEIDTLGKYPFKYYSQKFGGIKKSLAFLARRLATTGL